MRRLVLFLSCLALAGTAFAVDRVTVPSDGRPVTLDGLQVGGTYQLRVAGTMTFGRWATNGLALLNDACFEYNAKGFPDPLTVFQNSFGVIVCGDYRSDHTYVSAPFVAPSERLILWVFDTDYRDNVGVLDVEIIALQAALDQGYCILRKPDLFGPPNCFEFYLADAGRTADEDDWGGLDDDTCRWAKDGECDEPGIGTGACPAGTDTSDCLGLRGGAEDSCAWAFDGECDEPGIGTGVCPAGTDTFDCRGGDAMGALAVIRGGVCSVTDLGLRQNWQVDPTLGGPYVQWEAADSSMNVLSRYGGDLYGCLTTGGTDQPEDDDLPDDVERREQQLTQCDVWSVANSGGVEGTVDRWDVSTIPAGARFDLRFDAYQLPDRLRVGHVGTVVFESGWRGDSSYAGNPAYPGGIAGPGVGEALDMFAKGAANDFTVTVIGVDPDTKWEYSVRCRMP